MRPTSAALGSKKGFTKELDKLIETLEALQTTLHRILPFVPEVLHVEGPSSAVSTLRWAERVKGAGAF